MWSYDLLINDVFACKVYSCDLSKVDIWDGSFGLTTLSPQVSPISSALITSSPFATNIGSVVQHPHSQQIGNPFQTSFATSAVRPIYDISFVILNGYEFVTFEFIYKMSRPTIILQFEDEDSCIKFSVVSPEHDIVFYEEPYGPIKVKSRCWRHG